MARHCWSPDLDLNSPGPTVNPDRPSERAKRRHRLLLDMLLDGGDWTTIYKILAAYPYLQAEYTDRVMRAERASKEREKSLA